MTIAHKMESMISKSSWIRKMFEDGAKLKARHGQDKVFDFSLGNPNVPPPPVFREKLLEILNRPDISHGYMPNSGYPDVREAVAKTLSKEQNVQVSGEDVVMTCGAAGAMNVVLKSILNPGEEVLVPAPYFVEYDAYAANHGGVIKAVPTGEDFIPDMSALSYAISPKTRAVLINSPNNPTGVVYTKETIEELAELLARESRKSGRTIYLISDEPYRKIVFDGTIVPPVFDAYDNAVVATSYSKDLSLPGERIGHAAVNPKAAFRTPLLGAMNLANRILGYVNAPALQQRVIAEIQDACVDISEYARKRDKLIHGLEERGYEFVRPKGAFYLFPKTPIPDDVKFVQALQEELILTVPGSGFGGPGHFRIAYCVDDKTIEGAMDGFEKVMKRFSA